MTLEQFLQENTYKLHQAGIETARLDVLILLEDELERNRASLLAHPELELTPAQVTHLNTKITQRINHLPLAYIRGRASFYGRDFIVNQHVLVPRPETEMIIDCLLRLAQELPPKPHIADIGTGSGCIGITAQLEMPKSTVTLFDIDPSALSVALQNAKHLKVDVAVQQQDLLGNTDLVFDVVLANLPYVPTAYPINTAATREPTLALFAGKDGLLLYRRFWQQIADLSSPPKYIITESLPEQAEVLQAIGTSYSYKAAQMSSFVHCFTHKL